MQEVYSKAEDCFELYKLLKSKMGTKIEYEGTRYTETFSGKYFSYDRHPHSDFDFLYERGLSFYCKFCKNGFLRIGIGNAFRSSTVYDTSVGEKLAALSAFYEVLSEVFGEPTVFYTTKEDEEGLLSMQWSFINKEEEIQQFKDGTYFDDAEIDKLVVFGEPSKKMDGYQLSDTTKKLISKQVGLPYELLSYVDEYIDDFVKYKTGKEVGVSEYARIDGVPVTSFERKLSLEKD